MKRIKEWWYRFRLWRATRWLMDTGMAIYNAEDLRIVLDTSARLALYVRTSGHINNGRYKAKKKLYKMTDQLLSAQQRFVHCAKKNRMTPTAVIGSEIYNLGYPRWGGPAEHMRQLRELQWCAREEALRLAAETQTETQQAALKEALCFTLVQKTSGIPMQARICLEDDEYANGVLMRLDDKKVNRMAITIAAHMLVMGDELNELGVPTVAELWDVAGGEK